VRDDDILELDLFVRLEVARSRFADPDDLTALAQAPDEETHSRLAEFAALPADAVLALAGSSDPGVRTRLVRNARLPPASADLRTALLVDDPSAWVRSELLELDLSVPLRRRILASLREDQVMHPQPWMPEDLLVRIVAAAGDDHDLRCAAVLCLPAGSDLLRSLCSAADPSVRWDAAANSVLPGELRRRLVADEDADVRRAAIDPSLGIDVLLRLSEDPHAGVREEAVVACRQFTRDLTRPALDVAAAEQVLVRAVHDLDEHVRAAAALHVPLHRLVLDDPSEHVRCSLAKTSTDPDVLERLADDSEPEVVDDVTDNPGAPPDLLGRLCSRYAAEWAEWSGLADDEEPQEGYGPGGRAGAARRQSGLAGRGGHQPARTPLAGRGRRRPGPVRPRPGRRPRPHPAPAAPARPAVAAARPGRRTGARSGGPPSRPRAPAVSSRHRQRPRHDRPPEALTPTAAPADGAGAERTP
jgi:hypothetical protein